VIFRKLGDLSFSQRVWDMHSKNGLIDEVERSPYSLDSAENQFMGFVQKHFGGEKPTLHGNTVHFDKKFLEFQMPYLHNLLNYRIVDVSSFKLFFQSYMPNEVYNRAAPDAKHRAMDDIKGSIEEFRYYKTRILRS
jgi:oligoribonuclease